MLETTFLGHQGWMFATAKARILVDALLVEPFGHGGGVGVVWPPRQLDVAAMPPVDAVFFSHEHEDHFNIPSVNRLSRDIPIHIPERSSRAMRTILEELGFRVVLVSPGQTISIGDLKFTAFTPDHMRHEEQDEWETMPFLVQDTADGGSFFSPVDVTVSETMEAQLKQLGVTPGLWGYANNVLNLSFQEQPQRAAPQVQPIIARFFAEHKRRPPPPVASLMCGGGFSFMGARAWMNHAVFPLDSDELFTGMQAALPKERFLVPTPGMQIVSDASGIRSTAETSSFLRTAPRNDWPDRKYQPKSAAAGKMEPASGRAELKPGELDELAERLDAFAQFLYGGPLFRALYSLTGTPPQVKAAFVIKATSGGTDHFFEYDPTGCRFVRVDASSAMTAYAAGIECFVTDLLEFLRGAITPSALMFGRVVRWRNVADNLTGGIDHAIWSYGHPLRRPDVHLALYRALYAQEPKTVPQVKAARS